MTEPQYPPEWDTRPQTVEEAPERDYPAAWTRPEDRVSPSTSDLRPGVGNTPTSEPADERGQQLLDHAHRLTGRPELADRSAHPFTIN
ncbi:hypothetical protein RW1_040_00420 [Rhodococcus wratislaviensis NBRC 100605]|uniref:Uncharacterized protein n=1 Tax=Rhodococcus wratislaviensis NBRC 100605 TaxID=1219028 RepID=X0R8Q3_RHOWR|nr:hypothetical protein RW1_040_00420 [Rhodococcus wratislaviensis NBRC 100605]